MQRNREAEEATILYVLKLEQGKYYVGSTNNLDQRFAQHCNGNGSAWTQRYPPIEVQEEMRGCNRFHEDALVYTYMSRYGVENVRGGTHSAVSFQAGDREEIRRRLRHAANQCFNCGSSTHFANACPDLTSSRDPHEESRQHGRRRRLQCTRCGRESHTEESCFAITHANGDYLMSDYEQSASSEEELPAVCSRCGRDSHDSSACFAGTNVLGQPIRAAAGARSNHEEEESSSSDEEPVSSSRCGRNSHGSSACYDTTNVQGQPIGPVAATARRPPNNHPFCSRCGRDSHTTGSCYASTHADGRPLGEGRGGLQQRPNYYYGRSNDLQQWDSEEENSSYDDGDY